jgi:hypothetical protein
MKKEQEKGNDWLSPSKEEQSLLVLQGKCPHNQGWIYLGRYGDDITYICRSCGQHKSIE